MRAPLSLLLAAALGASSLVSPTEAHAAKIIVVDVRRAILDTEDGLRVQAALKRLFDQRQRELTALEQQFQSQQSALTQKVQSGTPQSALQPQLQQLQQMYVELNQRKNDYTNEMSAREQQLTTPIYGRILGLAKKLATQQGADLIVDRTAAAYFKGDLEITDKIIQMYNSGESGSTSGPPVVAPPPSLKPAPAPSAAPKGGTPNF
jgi:outer membrane protein